MRMMLAICQRECDQWIRQVRTWVIVGLYLICWGWIIGSFELASDHTAMRGFTFYQWFSKGLPLLMLFVAIWGVYEGRKVRFSSLAEVVMTSPVSNGAWISGQWLSGQGRIGLYTLLTVLIQGAWYLWGGVSTALLATDLLYTGVMMGTGLMFFYTCAFVCSTLFRGGWVYLLVVGGWLLLTWLWLNLGIGNNLLTSPIWFIVTPLGMSDNVDSLYGIWGTGLQWQEGMLHQSVMLGITLLILSLGWGWLARIRRNPLENRWVVVMTLLTILLTIGCGGMRYSHFASDLQAYKQEGKVYAIKGSEYREQHAIDRAVKGWVMKSLQLTLSLPKEHWMKVDGKGYIVNESDSNKREAWVTLYHGLKVKKLYGKNVSRWSREGDWVHLQLKEPISHGEGFAFQLQYQGNPERIWNMAGRIKTGFIQKEGLLLRKEDGWYPLVGKRRLGVGEGEWEANNQYYVNPVLMRERVKTDFDVTVSREVTTLPMASTLPAKGQDHFQGASVYGVALVAGQIAQQNYKGVQIVAPPELMAITKKGIAEQLPFWRRVHQWLGDSVKPKVLFFSPIFYQVNWLEEFTDDGVEIIDERSPTSLLKEDDEHKAMLWNPVERIGSNLEVDPDSDLLKTAIIWGLSKEVHKQFKDFFHYAKITATLEDEDNSSVIKSARLLSDIDKQNEKEYQKIVRFLYQEYRREGAQDFSLAKSIQRYEKRNEEEKP
ncbi:ABC transporter permease [Marininema halotolerans]|uniref:ABC-type transport system involved in multi-copper enzyme maturation, permease component n=1 Tax=Marininema halotolerans TaxID=1155944 RepID=A0A1I6NTZ6_9BACL|nr:hypothetical protein [Marininema halotolerans]SFS31413.1 ABC-type transport system involved in multi-copper enzyme maturation, permease component [Marininema halotolerans]